MPRYTVSRFMTADPVSISSDRTLAEAHRLMREKQIRHLPVVDAGRLVGLVSQRDLYLLETLQGVDPDEERVEEAMTAEPFTVSPDALLEDVASAMAEHKYGSAVVVDAGAVVGLFTTIDALRALAIVLRRPRRQPADRRATDGAA
jgi:acetoin utilization protein AcuB